MRAGSLSVSGGRAGDDGILWGRVDVTVLLPTRDRLPALTQTLHRLGQQERAGLDAEIVVVDNGSTDGTAQAVEALAADYPFPLRVLSVPGGGVSRARNVGVAQARGRLILSLNDDTAPADRYLITGHCKGHGASADLALLGRITYPSEELTDPFYRFLNNDAQFAYGQLGDSAEPDARHFWTAHMSFARERFLAVGGMNEQLPFGFEDIELGDRMLKSGVRLRYEPTLLAVHDHPTDLRSWRRRQIRMGEAGALVNRLQPSEPRLAQPATGWYWLTLEVAAAALAVFPVPWHRLPAAVRSRAYIILNQGAYARGYRRAEATT